eukprot:4631295-Pleurochrysis_carterae.AAC.1
MRGVAQRNKIIDNDEDVDDDDENPENIPNPSSPLYKAKVRSARIDTRRMNAPRTNAARTNAAHMNAARVDRGAHLCMPYRSRRNACCAPCRRVSCWRTRRGCCARLLP